MRFLADENIPQSTIIALEKVGHDVFDIKKQNRGLRDSALMRIANDQQRIVLSADKDFLGLHRSQKGPCAVVIADMNVVSIPRLMDVLEKLFSELGDSLNNAACIVENDRVRIKTQNRND